MKMSRRGLLSATALLGASYFERSSALVQKIRDQHYAICQGATDETSTTLSAVVNSRGKYQVRVLDESGRSSGHLLVTEHKRDFSEYKVLQIKVQGLRLGVDYTLEISTNLSSHVEQRSFRALHIEKESSRIALISCMNDHLHSARSWQSLERQRVDALFFLGDAVYADMLGLFRHKVADPEQLWQRFVEAWNKLDFYKWPELKPVFAIWDDHDFGDNNSDRSYVYRGEAADNFRIFYGLNTGPALNYGPGVSFQLQAFGQNFLFLDGRTFRTEKGAARESLFGREQEEWIFSRLSEGQDPAWLMSGSQWFGGYLEKESYEFTHPDSFSSFIDKLRRVPNSVSFVSGDVHFSEIMELEESLLGYKTLEITASSMHSMTVPGWHRIFRNPRRIASTSRHNFLVLELLRNRLGGQVERIQSFGKGRSPIFSVRREQAMGHSPRAMEVKVGDR